MTIEMIERSYLSGDRAYLILKNPRGRVEITGGEQGRIVISAAIHTDTGRADRTHVEIEQASDGSVTAITQYDGITWFGFTHERPCRVDYSVRLPRQCRMELSIVEGQAIVEGLDGELRIHSVSGALSLKDLHGSLFFETVSGGISGEGLNGPLEVRTVSGKVRLDRSQFPRLQANTVSGGLSIETPLLDGPYAIHSVSGNARLFVHPQTNCSVRFHSLSGRLHSDLEGSRRFNGKGQFHLDLGQGGPELSWNSISGDLHLLTTEQIYEERTWSS